jgi:hypothetical protein
VDSTNVTATLTLSTAAAGALSTGTFGTVTSTFNVATGIWTASGAVADVNAALAAVSFNPALNFNGSFTVATSISDGEALAITGSKTFTGIAVNDAPEATNLSAPETYTEDTPLNLTNIVVSDVDSPNVTATLTLSNTAAGALSTGTFGTVTSSFEALTGVWTASGSTADVNAALAAVSFNPALNFNGNFSVATSVTDGVAAPITGSKSFTGVAVNDAPTATNLNAAETYTEDTPLNLTDIVVADVDSTNVTATLTLSNAAAGALSTGTFGTVTSTFNAGTGTWIATGAVANVNAALAAVSFNPALNFNGSFTVSTSVTDGVAAPITGSKVFTGVAVNDAPTATNLSAPETYTEDTPLNLTDIVVADVDSATVTATLTLSNTAAGALSTGTFGTVTSTFNAGTGTWTAIGAVADVNAALAAVSFNPAFNFNGNFSVATSVTDGVAAPITGSKSFTGVAVNDAPTATNLNAAETYTEDTPLNLTNIVVADVDSANVTATLTLSNTAAGALTTGTFGGTTATFNAATGVWTAAGAIADVNAALAAVTFNPASNFNSSFSIATSVSDGVAAAITGTKSFTGIAVNDAPDGTNKSVSLGEDTSYTFAVADFGFTDTADAGQTLIAVKIATLPVAATGTLLFNNAAIAAGTSVTAADIASGRLTFVPADDSTAAASFTFQVQDSGGTTNGGIDLDPTANTASFTIVAGTDLADNKTNGNAANTTFDVNFALPGNLNVSILDAGGTDVLNEQGLLTYGTFRFERFSNNLELTAVSGTKTLHVALLDQYVGANAIESVTFQNGGQVGTSGGGFTLGTAAYSLAQGGTGTAGSDVLAGSSQDDVLSGLAGKDLLFGSGGNDSLTGGTGNDLLVGGLGRDTFVFAESGAANADTLLDFQAGIDSIQLAVSAFAAAEANPDGTLKANNFAAQANATTANQHILFDPATGSLFYDADGSGAGAKVLVAQFELAGLTGTLSATDFKIV